MSTSAGRHNILNPEGYSAILDLQWAPEKFSEEVRWRVDNFIRNYLRSDDVQKIFQPFHLKIQNLKSRILQEFSQLEKELINETNDRTSIEDSNESTDLPIKEILLSAVFGISVILSPIWLAVYSFKNRQKIKLELIDEAYKKCMLTVAEDIRKEVNLMWGDILKAEVKDITEDILKRRIESQHKMSQQLVEFRKENIARRDKLLGLEKQVDKIEKEVISSLGLVLNK